MAIRITTANLPESQRFAFWRDTVSDRFVQLDCVQTSNRPFDGEIAAVQMRDLSFLSVRGHEYTVIRTPLRISQASEQVVLVALQVRGTCRLAQDGRDVLLTAGDFACCDSTRPYSASVSDDFEIVSLRIPRATWLTRLGRTEPVTARAVRGSTPAGGLVADFLRRFALTAEHIGPGAEPRFAEASLALVAGALDGLVANGASLPTASRSALLGRARSLIEAHLHDPTLDREAVARRLGISVRYLQDLFRDEQSGISEWIWKRRLDRSRRDLGDPLLGGKSIGQVATDNGFSDVPHFCRRFRAAFGVTPSAFRQQTAAERAPL